MHPSSSSCLERQTVESGLGCSLSTTMGTTTTASSSSDSSSPIKSFASPTNPTEFSSVILFFLEGSALLAVIAEALFSVLVTDLGVVCFEADSLVSVLLLPLLLVEAKNAAAFVIFVAVGVLFVGVGTE